MIDNIFDQSFDELLVQAQGEVDATTVATQPKASAEDDVWGTPAPQVAEVKEVPQEETPKVDANSPFDPNFEAMLDQVEAENVKKSEENVTEVVQAETEVKPTETVVTSEPAKEAVSTAKERTDAFEIDLSDEQAILTEEAKTAPEKPKAKRKATKKAEKKTTEKQATDSLISDDIKEQIEQELRVIIENAIGHVIVDVLKDVAAKFK